VRFAKSQLLMTYLERSTTQGDKKIGQKNVFVYIGYDSPKNGASNRFGSYAIFVVPGFPEI
jgi:hypothetical protein